MRPHCGFRDWVRSVSSLDRIPLSSDPGDSPRNQIDHNIMNSRSFQPRRRRATAILSLIGNTPTVPLFFEPEGVTIYAKCEFLNPSGSIKDRLAKTVLVDAEERGLLWPDSVILECSSGNTGIALSMLGTAMGYHVTILMSQGASQERRLLIRQLGAELILFESKGRYQTGIDMSREMAKADERCFLTR